MMFLAGFPVIVTLFPLEVPLNFHLEAKFCLILYKRYLFSVEILGGLF